MRVYDTIVDLSVIYVMFFLKRWLINTILVDTRRRFNVETMSYVYRDITILKKDASIVNSPCVLQFYIQIIAFSQ